MYLDGFGVLRDRLDRIERTVSSTVVVLDVTSRFLPAGFIGLLDEGRVVLVGRRIGFIYLIDR